MRKQIDDGRLQSLLSEWHEAGKDFPGLCFVADPNHPLRIKGYQRKRRYIVLTEGGARMFLIDQNDGTVYEANSRVPRVSVGNIETITGADLHRSFLRNWRSPLLSNEEKRMLGIE